MRLFLSFYKLSTSGRNKKSIKNIPKLTDKIQQFEKLVDYFTNNQDKFLSHLSLSIQKYHNLNHLAWYARSSLICHQKFDIEEAYRTVKINLLRQEGQLTPHSCTLLMETLTYFHFQGDQNGILQKLCDYYEKMGYLFTEYEEKHFWMSYVKIMGRKAHSTVKYRNVQRRNNQMLANLGSNIYKYYLNKMDENGVIKKNSLFPQILKTANYQKDEVILKLGEGKDRLRVKGFDIFNKVNNIDDIERDMFLQLDHNEQFAQLFEEQSTFSKEIPIIVNQIYDLNKALKKGWKVIIHGNLKNYDNFSMQNSQIDEYVKEKILENVHYQQGICYDMQNPSKRSILHTQTLISGIKSQYFQSGMIYFCQKVAQQQKQMAKFLTLKQLQTIKDHAEICGFHWKLLSTYNYISHWKQSQYGNKLKQDLGILNFQEEIRDAMNRQNAQQQKMIFTKYQSEQLAQLALKKCKQIGIVDLQTDYYPQRWNNQTLRQLVRYSHWSLNNLLPDCRKIYNIYTKIAQQTETGSNSKVLVVTDKRDSLQVLCHFIEGRYLVEREVKDDLQDIKTMILRKMNRPYMMEARRNNKK